MKEIDELEQLQSEMQSTDKFRIIELKEVVKQLQNSIECLKGVKRGNTELMFCDGYNHGIDYAIAVINIDIQAIETKIKLIQNLNY